MIYVSCPHCLSHFGVDRESYPEAPLALRCAHCKNSFWLHPDGRTEPDDGAHTSQMTPFAMPSAAEIQNLSSLPPEANNLQSIVLIEDDPFASGEQFESFPEEDAPIVTRTPPSIEGMPSLKSEAPSDQTVNLSSLHESPPLTIQQSQLDVGDTMASPVLTGSPKQSWMELPEIVDKSDSSKIELQTEMALPVAPVQSWDELPAAGEQLNIHSASASPKQSWMELPEVPEPGGDTAWSDDSFLSSPEPDPFDEPGLDDDWLGADKSFDSIPEIEQTSRGSQSRLRIDSGGFRAPSGPGSRSNHSSPILRPVEFKLEGSEDSELDFTPKKSLKKGLKKNLEETAQFNLGDQPMPEDSQELEALLQKQHPTSASAEFNRARFESRSERIMGTLLPLMLRSVLVIAMFMALATVFIQLKHSEGSQSRQNIVGLMFGALLPTPGDWKVSSLKLYTLPRKRLGNKTLYVLQGKLKNRLDKQVKAPVFHIRTRTKGRWKTLLKLRCCAKLSPFNLAKINSSFSLRQEMRNRSTRKKRQFLAGEVKTFRVGFLSRLQLRNVKVVLVPEKK